MADRKVALIAGVTGIAGLNLAKKMLSTDKYGRWKVYGLSRRKSEYLPSEVNHVCCDLLDASACKERLAPLTDVTHVFYTTWINKVREVDNVEANGDMLKNLLTGLPAKINHFVLLTGLKHYIGPFDAGESGQTVFPTPYKESFGRLPGENFYYTLEDILFKRAEEVGFTWSVARPACIVGFAPFNQMNLGATIAAYAAICKYSGKPFAFPGSKAGYDILLNITDADLLAEHMLWEATDPVARNQAYNVVNGDIFRWSQMWRAIADHFGLKVPDEVGSPVNSEELKPIWDEMVQKLDLKHTSLDDITTMWFLMVLQQSTDFVADMNKSREHGFLTYQNSEKTFLKLFDCLRQNRLIPK